MAHRFPHMRNSAHLAHKRRNNDRAVIENPLSHLTDDELIADVDRFVDEFLPSVDYDALLRAARVAKDVRIYDEVIRSDDQWRFRNLPVQLTPEERRALRRERDVPFSEKGMRIVILTVSLAALLQGFVQSSFNGATLYKGEWGLIDDNSEAESVGDDEWELGGTNAAPWFFAAVIGCPLALPINYWYGRRGGLIIAAVLIFASSLASAWCDSWQKLFAARIFNGLGMGIKAVSTPILASETAVGFWRGSSVLAWQLWVAFGIMLGFAFNLIFAQASDKYLTYALINAAPMIPALALFVVVLFCPESPRYHLMKGPNFSPKKAYQILRRLRNTELQALRDMYTVQKSIELEYMGEAVDNYHAKFSPGFWITLLDFARQFQQLFQQRRLYNAVMATSTVALAQQLCGVNVLAFYSGTLFNSTGADRTLAMGYSLGFGGINFLFALPAIRSIDILGRRQWLLMTLPIMALCMFGGSMAFQIDGGMESSDTRTGVVAFFLFMFAIAYSPGLGPIPFTLASESFPLTHREAGTAWAVSINLAAAGLLAMFYPRIARALTDSGSLGFFAGLNVLAFVMVFLLVEETKRRSLEDLDLVFAVSKRKFMSFNIQQYAPWWVRHYIFRRRLPRPELYHDMIWGPIVTKEHHVPPIGDDSVPPSPDGPAPPPPPKSPPPVMAQNAFPVEMSATPRATRALSSNPLAANPLSPDEVSQPWAVPPPPPPRRH